VSCDIQCASPSANMFDSEHGNKEVELAGVLSPVSKKKTGRAYVALARAHSEKYVLPVVVLLKLLTSI